VRPVTKRPKPKPPKSEPLRLCFATAECAPFAKRGGLGDVAAALTGWLAGRGHDVRTFLPLYGSIDREAHGLTRHPEVQGVEIEQGPHRLAFDLWTTGSNHSGPYHFVDCPQLFGGPEVYAGDDSDPPRFGYFCRAVLESCRALGWSPQVFHSHDWHAALLPLYARSLHAGDPGLSAARHLLTLHNVGFQGVTAASRLPDLGLADHAGLFDPADLAEGKVNLLKAAIATVDFITTVSPTHAWEIQTADGGVGLDGLLAQRRHRLAGIVNGIDVEEWDPATDPHLAAHYTVDDLYGKLQCRRTLAEELGLDYEPGAPTAGIVSRLTWQKGFDLLFEPLPEVLAGSDLRLAVLGTGEEKYEGFFADLAHRFPGRVAFRREFSEPLAHRIEAGCDLFLMPSRYEPCGLNQMYSQRYGTLPLVRRTGGLADTVEPYTVDGDGEGGGETGTGFMFEHFTPEGFRWALDQALATWKQRAVWARLMRRAMTRDFSWDKRGEENLGVDRKLAE